MLAKRPTKPKNRWQAKPFASTCALLTTLLFSHASFAADARTDYDLDDDGLIEINDLSDLDEIRNNLDGKTLYGSNAGCPNADDGTVNGGCIGFELTTDLDFDTNQDGVMDANDLYWNAGDGWVPVGVSQQDEKEDEKSFRAIFEGNGYTIRNLVINRPYISTQGLFGYTNGAVIRNVGLTGRLMKVHGGHRIGALVGVALSTNFENVFNTGVVNGKGNWVGGIVGVLSFSTLTNTFNIGVVKGRSSIGGLVGVLNSSQIENGFNTGPITATRNAGGLVGEAYSGEEEGNNSAEPVVIRYGLSLGLISGVYDTGGIVGEIEANTEVVIENSYWAKDTTGAYNSHSQSEINSYLGFTLATLKCAIQANTNSSNSSCVSADGSAEGLTGPATLFKGWDQALVDGQSLWGFGTDQQVPAMILNGKEYRDSDRDSVFDFEDAFPLNYAASQDSDEDGFPDAFYVNCDSSCIADSGLQVDQLPLFAEAWKDEDYDGLPDEWAITCDVTCQSEATTVLDSHLNDTDNDGVTDPVDDDDNNDGIRDIDIDNDGLVDIDNLAELNAMRYQLDGIGLRNSSDGVLDQSGCPRALHQGVLMNRCHGYELTTDLDFDTNQDGIMDSRDTYWNDGRGWSSVGKPINNSLIVGAFSSVFNGNGYVIRNLYIDNFFEYQGLFGFASGAVIRNVGLTGPLMRISGGHSVGSLVGKAYMTNIENVFNTGMVQGRYGVGGIVGYLSTSSLVNTINTGSVLSERSVGGLVGISYSHDSTNTIRNSLSTGLVEGDEYVGGLLGSASNSLIENSYWATDMSGQSNSYGESELDSYIGLPLITLQCALQANTNSTNSDCVSADGSAEGLTSPVTLFKDWGQAVLNGQGLWDFGTNTQLPAFALNGHVYRDSDGDSVVDSEDDFPLNFAASKDTDDDGKPDAWNINCDSTCISNSGMQLDQLPQHAEAWKDIDLDGFPDEWAANCDVSCQSVSSLTLDIHMNDTDNDGIDNLTDDDDNNDGVVDVDADSDGLIDISTLAQLNTIRYQLDGAGLRIEAEGELNQSGCPEMLYQGTWVKRCHGYELMTNLNFDTNQDGAMDARDTYWNNGSGFEPLGFYDYELSNYKYFNAVFEGNGHIIRNLFIVIDNNRFLGLFGYANNAVIRNLGLTGSLMKIHGGGYVGSMVGYARSTDFENVFNTGDVQGNDYVGGIVGGLFQGTITNGFNTGIVKGNRYVGGLVARLQNSGEQVAIQNVFNTGLVTGNSNVGGLIALNYSDGAVVKNSYWASDLLGQSSSDLQSEIDSYVGLPLSVLQCAVQANTSSSNSDCLSDNGVEEGLSGPVTLYKEWNQSLWSFGSSLQLPMLVGNGNIIRDSDGDGSIDDEDGFPFNFSANLDTDGDGYPDSWNIGCDDACIANSGLLIDRFPLNEDAWQDNDLDGLPDSWAASCDVSCQNASSLVLDLHLNDIDNDGIDNQADTDDNNDGILDIDADSDGLVDITNLAKLSAIRHQLDGKGLRTASEGHLDQSGCPVVILQGVVVNRCHGYELTTDLDFDTNQDGIMDANDDYWNNGEGWSPVGLNTIFEGNGYVIRNLFIDRPNNQYQGLFGATQGAHIRNLGLTGALMHVSANAHTGALTGRADNSTIENVFNTGSIEGTANTGGLIGTLANSRLLNSSNTGSVSGKENIGGLVGFMLSSDSTQFSTIRNSISTGFVTGDLFTGGLIGRSYNSRISVLENSYWATDASGQGISDSSSEANSYVGLPLVTLQCAIQADSNSSNSICVSGDGLTESLNGPVTLFNGWDQDLLGGQALWDFGTNSQLPGLTLNGNVYRDSDGDGTLDEDDAYPLIAIGNLLDTDNDGAPDTCDANCLALNMTADLDDDNDGVLDTVDTFPLDNTEHSDFDNDGTGDVADLDDDNDGVNDVDDPNLGEDNGKPEIINVPSIDPVAVTTENGDAFELLVDDNFLNAFTTYDAVDTEFTYEASLNGNVLAIDENDIMLIPAGRQAVQVVAIDTSGNRSEPVELVAIVYPQVRFEQATSIIGENSTTNIKVSLTGDAPDYPVVINFAINELSYVNQADLDAGFDIEAQHQMMIEAGDAEALNRDGFILIPIVDDNESENDELLFIDLLSAKLESETDDAIESLFVIDETNMQHELTVTYQNLAPVVNLKLEQNGIEVANVQQDAGMVSITAIVQDGNGNDVHTLTWDLNNLGLNAPLGNTLNFSPASLPVSTYEISVIATDNGVGQLSDDAVIRFDVVAPPEEPVDGDSKETEEPKSSGGSGGGAVSLWLMLLLFALVSGVGVRRVNTFSLRGY